MSRNNGAHRCPVCGKHEFSAQNSYEICPECGWEDDAAQEDDPNEALGPNYMSLGEYRDRYKDGWRPEWLADNG